jgi:hypothetical protein
MRVKCYACGEKLESLEVEWYEYHRGEFTDEGLVKHYNEYHKSGDAEIEDTITFKCTECCEVLAESEEEAYRYIETNTVKEVNK